MSSLLRISLTDRVTFAFLAFACLTFPSAELRAEIPAIQSPGAIPVGQEPRQVAVVKQIEGELEILRQEETLSGDEGQSLFIGDELRTKEADRALIEFLSDNSLVKITYDTTVRLTGQEDEKNKESRIMIMRGLMWGKKILPAPALRIRTPICVLSVRGTEYFVKVVSPDISEVVVKEGTVDISYEGMNLQASDMSHVILQKGKAPLVEGITERLMNEEWVQRFA